MAKNTQLQEGQQKTVYKDVMFETQAEAEVTLVRKLAANKDKELWLVTIPSGMQMQKWIKKVL